MSYPSNVNDFDAGDWIKVFIPPIIMFFEILFVSYFHEKFENYYGKLFQLFNFNHKYIKIVWFLLSWCIGFSWGFSGNTTLSYIFFISLLVCIFSWGITFVWVNPVISYFIIYIAVTLSSLIWADGSKKAAMCIIPFLTWLAFSASFNYYVVINRISNIEY